MVETRNEIVMSRIEIEITKEIAGMEIGHKVKVSKRIGIDMIARGNTKLVNKDDADDIAAVLKQRKKALKDAEKYAKKEADKLAPPAEETEDEECEGCGDEEEEVVEEDVVEEEVVEETVEEEAEEEAEETEEEEVEEESEATDED